MPQRVFVTGGSGFVGKAVIEELLRMGWGVNALVNRKPLEVAGDVKSIAGRLFDAGALDSGMKGCEAVIHLVGIIAEKPKEGITFERIHFEGTKSVVDAAARNGVIRYVQMSALGTRANAEADYHKTKWEAEEYVRRSGLRWTIFRPSLIHGPEGEFMQMEVKWAKKKAAPFLFMPYFGAGLLGLGRKRLVQPVYVKDVGRAFVEAIRNEKTVGQTYDLGGAERMTWAQMHKGVARAFLGKDRATLGIPAWYAKVLAAVVPSKWLPFNRDQVMMSQEDGVAEMEKFGRDFGWKTRGFEETIREYARSLK